MKRFFLLCVLAMGCKTVEVKPLGAAPAFTAQELSVPNQTLTQFDLKFTGTVSSGEAATLEKAVFELVVDEKVVHRGEQSLEIAIAAGASVSFVIDQSSQYVASAEELKAMDTRGGSLLTAIRGKVTVKIGASRVEVPFARSREVRVPRLPHAKFQDLEAGRYSEDEAGVTFHVGVFNPNPFQVTLAGIAYTVSIAGKQVAEGMLGKGDRVSPSSTGVFDIEAKVSADSHGAEVKKLIKSKSLPYVIAGEMNTELYKEPFEFKGEIKLNASK